MLEKFSDYEGGAFINEEGTFRFQITSYEMRVAKSGADMAVFSVMSDHGGLTIYHSLDKAARWSYNNLIRACKHITPEMAKSYELDYETIGKELVGTWFVGVVKAEQYTKQSKVVREDGTFESVDEIATSYKIKKYGDELDYPELVFPNK